MKIVYCIPSLHNSGGMERVLTEKANYLAEKVGWNVTIVTSNQKCRPVFYPLSNKIQLVDIDIDYEGIKNQGLFTRIYSRLKVKREHKIKLARLLKNLKPDVTVSMFTHEMTFLPDIKDGSKKILELHFSKSYRRLDGKSNGISCVFRFINLLLDYFDRKKIAKYDKFVVLTNRDKADWNMSSGKICVIHNPTAFENVELCDVSVKRALAVGRLCPQKGFDSLIKIWSTLPDALLKEWKLDIVGSGPDRDKLQMLIDRHDVHDSITLCNPTSDMPGLYKNHSVFCFPSRYEGFGLSLLEACSFGLSCVAFDCPCGPSEIITSDKTGFLIPLGDNDAYADKLRYVLENESRRSEVKNNILEFINNNFTKEIIMHKWINLFSDVLSSK